MKKIGCLFFLAVLLVAGGVGFYFWNFYNDAINRPNDGSADKKIVTIAKGASIDDINTLLVSNGVIKDQKLPNGMSVFKVYSVLNKLDSKFQAGTYFLAQNLSLKDIAEAIQKSKDEMISVTIKEGLRIEEIADAINVSLNSADNTKFSKFNREDFIRLTKNFPDTAKKYEFLNTRSKDVVTLEGYLFPDTYFVTKDTSTETMIDLLLRTFEAKVYLPFKGQIQNNKYTLHELITLASIVEREGKTDDDRAMIADIFFRRLTSDSLGRKLESDVTMLYILGNEKTGWWKAQITDANLIKPSPYNTRLTPGLPPTPIDSPSLSSVQAVLSPKANDNIFFIAGDDGKVYFAKTLSQHNANIQKYCKILCQ